MGNRLGGFDVEIGFDNRGQVDIVYYHDCEGCGHEEVIELTATVEDLVAYHLDHYKRSHRMEPPRMCEFSVVIEGGGRLECLKEVHSESIDHMFKYNTK